ncbi:MAG: TonB-dependent receptor [Bacteroidota bacterium]
MGHINNFNSPTKVTTIDSIARKELNLQDIGELLAAFTPVFVKSYGRGSLSTVSFRGTGASHTKVLWEGININSPMLGQTDFSLLPSSFFDKIELQYGGGSLTSVSGALGGSIRLESNGIKKDNQINIQQSIGSYNTYLTSASVYLNKSNLYSSTRIIRQSSLNNFSYYNNAILPSGEEMTQSDAEFTNIGFTQQFSYNISDKQQVSFITWNQWNTRNIPAIMTNIQKGGNQTEWNTNFFSRNILKWVLHNEKTRWEAVGAYFYEELDYFLETKDELNNPISLIDSRNKVETYSFAWNVSSELQDNFIFKIGMEMLQQKVNSNNYLDTKQRNSLSNYVSLKKSFKDKLTAEALLRAEIINATFIPIMPMLGINYKPFTNQNFNFRINISRNYNIPSLNDLYWYPGGNEDLNPEKSLEMEAGVDYATKLNMKHSLTLSLSAYSSLVDDWIIWLPGDYRYWSPQNIAEVYARGGEFSARVAGSFGKVDYNIFGEYSYTRTTNNSDSAVASGLSDVQLMYVPIHTANGYMVLSTSGYYVNWSLSYTSSRNTSLNNDENYSFPLPDYMLNNVSIGKRLALKKTNLDVRFKVYNIFNIDYQAILWRAMPGRNYEISLSFTM